MKVKKEAKQEEKVIQEFHFEQILNDKHTRIEYIRKDRGHQPRMKIGVMMACIDPMNTNNVLIGFSLCHGEYDDFDKINFGETPVKNFGKLVAFKRALKWRDLNSHIVYDKKLKERSSEIVYIPATVHNSLAKFVLSAYYYYNKNNDKKFPMWVLDYFPIPAEKEGDV